MKLKKQYIVKDKVVQTVNHYWKGGITLLGIVLKYWIDLILTGITGFSAFILKKVYSDFKRDRTEQEVLKIGMIALLHDSLFHNCESYISKGEITIDELNNLETLYASYHALGGNGTGTALYERCKNLKIKTK